MLKKTIELDITAEGYRAMRRELFDNDYAPFYCREDLEVVSEFECAECQKELPLRRF